MLVNFFSYTYETVASERQKHLVIVSSALVFQEFVSIIGHV